MKGWQQNYLQAMLLSLISPLRNLHLYDLIPFTHQESSLFVLQVISLTKLRKNYKSYESKRQLADLYDVFICDDRIYHLLPKLLGKAFFAKKKWVA